jgi:septum formation protein
VIDERNANGLLQAAAPRLVLASGSAARRALLTDAGLRFDVVVPDIDEAAVKFATRNGGGQAEQAALALASMKAAAVTDREAVVIGCDQILVCGTSWFDKPATAEVARHQLNSLRGRSHTLVTAVACHRGGERVWRHVEAPKLTMRPFSGAFLDAYMRAEGDAVLTTVGAYRLEGLGAHLFDAIEGEHASILGLPLTKLLGFLRQIGLVLA